MTRPRHSGSGSDIGESPVQGRKVKERWEGLLPSFACTTAPMGLMDFQTKGGMAHLAAQQSAAQTPWCFSFALLSPSGPPPLNTEK